jgi:hypothetical protein
MIELAISIMNRENGENIKKGMYEQGLTGKIASGWRAEGVGQTIVHR